MKYLHYDVFTSERLLGNQLAVFTDARGVDERLMQRIAREMNFSESTFILPAEQRGTDTRMRIFTPGIELPMAGHPTIGSTFALAHTGFIARGASRFVFGLNIGPVPVDLEWGGEGLRFAWMTQSKPRFGPVVPQRSDVAATLGLTSEDLVAELPVQEVSCGLPYLLVPLRDRETVDRARFTAGPKGPALQTPIFLLAISDAGPLPQIYSRMFAPGFGVIEDPATGSASGPLGCYLVEHGMVTGDAAQRIVSSQGVAMGRASRIHIAITGEPGAISSVKVGGQAVLVGRGELLL
jgi:trans-2,3-dihydro-3-hydroxyanthranilate isomerase